MMLGVLGGMGPLATVDFMGKVVRNTSARCDQQHIEMIVCSAPHIPDRTEAIRDEGIDPFPAMLEALRRLERAGAGCIAIPCNTAHHWHAALQASTELPILHIVDAVTDLLRREGIADGTIGLLATDGTLATGVYQDRLSKRGYTCLAPHTAEQVDVMRAIRLVKADRVDAAAVILEAVAQDLLERGCRRVAMACTEIPLALAGVKEPLRSRLLDPTDALARASVYACSSVRGPGLRGAITRPMADSDVFRQ